MIATFLKNSKVTAILNLEGMNIPSFSLVPYKLLNEVDISRLDFDTIIFSNGHITVVKK